MGQESNRSIKSELQDPEKQFDLLVRELPEQYELLGKLNQGAMAAIYKARNRRTGEILAIKVLKPECADDDEARQRFILEATATGGLKHPQICQVYDFGCTHCGMLYLVMEWIDGISLQSMIDNDGALSFREALPVFLQIASALGHAHEMKLVHRDLKPANVMLSGRKDGGIAVHLVDFGIAKLLSDNEDSLIRAGLTGTGFLVGTPCYMSPEQARGEKIDQRSDIYAFGCLMYFVLTGHPPFDGADFLETMYKQINEPAPEIDRDLEIPEDLKLIVLKSLEKAVENRYQSMEQVGIDLEKLAEKVNPPKVNSIKVNNEPTSPPPPTVEHDKVRSNPGALLCLVLALLIMGAAYIGLQSWFSNSRDKMSTDSGQKTEDLRNLKH